MPTQPAKTAKKAPATPTKRSKESTSPTAAAKGNNTNVSAAAVAKKTGTNNSANTDDVMVTADHTLNPPVSHDAQIRGTTNMADHEVPHYGNADNNDFDPQRCLMERSGKADLHLPHLHTKGSGSFRQHSNSRDEDCDDANTAHHHRACSPVANYTLKDFTAIKPQEFHPRDDQPMMGRGGHGWISEVDGTTASTAATPDRAAARRVAAERKQL